MIFIGLGILICIIVFALTAGALLIGLLVVAGLSFIAFVIGGFAAIALTGDGHALSVGGVAGILLFWIFLGIRESKKDKNAPGA